MRPLLEAELTAHAHALRALARLLVGEGHADDLVQDTALQALQSPPSRAAGLRGWLSQVLRRLASNHHRGRSRRQRREQLVEPPRPPEPAARVAEHHEAVQRVTAALLGLPEPYHGTLLLRFFEELTPTAIAQVTGVPLATVKSRLQRGLALLRERLDAEAKGKDWRPALAAAFGVPQAAAVGAAVVVSTGVLLMGSGVKLAVGGVAAAAAMLLWLPSEPAPKPALQPTAHALAPLAVSAPLAAQQSEPSSVLLERREVPAAALAVVAPGALATVRGRCVDEHGSPIAGVAVELHGSSRSSAVMDAWTKDHESPQDIDEKQATGSDGVFVFRFWPPPPLQFLIRLQQAERVTVESYLPLLAEGRTKDLGDVVIPRGVLVRGRVVDRDGVPVANADVGFVSNEQSNGDTHPCTYANGRTLSDGKFQAIWPLPPGDYVVRVLPQRKPTPDHLSFDGIQPVVDVVLVVDQLAKSELPSIRGIIVDENGQPVARASVGLVGYMQLAGHHAASDSSSNREGRFVLKQPDKSRPEVSLHVQKTGFEDLSPEEMFTWGRDDVRLVLRHGLAVEVTVVADADGAPVEDFQVRVFPDPSVRERPDNHYGVRARGHHDGGHVVVDGIVRGDWCVLVEPKGEQLATSAFVPVRVADPGPTAVTVRLPRCVGRQLRVQFADGSPVAGTHVQLADAHGKGLDANTMVKSVSAPSWGQRNTALLLQEVTTDARGEAKLLGPSDVPLALFVRGPGHVPCVQSEVRVDIDEPLVVTVSRGARLVGKVGPPAALAELRRLADIPETGAKDATSRSMLPGVRLVRVEPGRWLHDSTSDSCTIADDGAFVIAGAPPGHWHVTVTWVEAFGDGALRHSYNGKATVASIDLRDGTTTQVALDLSSLLPGEIDAQVLHNGKPAANREFEIRAIVGKSPSGSDEAYARNVTTDADGHFHLRTRPGDYEVLDYSSRMRLHAAEHAFVVAGQTTAQTFRLQSGTLRLRLLDAQDKPVRGVRIDLGAAGAGATIWCWLPLTDADGSSTVETDILPCTLAVLPRRLQDPKAQQELLQQNGDNAEPFTGLRLGLGHVTPKAGETTEVELRLPAEWDR